MMRGFRSSFPLPRNHHEIEPSNGIMPRMASLKRPAIIAGHPGHELHLFAWLARTRPLVLILTDGSGGASASRIGFSLELIDLCGGRPGPVFGHHSDRELYSWLLEGRTSELEALCERIVCALENAGVDSIICDGFEGYNPVHDLAHAFAWAAGRRLDIPVWEHLLASLAERRPGDLAIELSDELYEQKMRAAGRYVPLRHEVAQAMAREGGSRLRLEVLRPVAHLDLSRFAIEAPYYETYGAEQVAAGRYAEPLRYASHVRPAFERILRDQCTTR